MNSRIEDLKIQANYLGITANVEFQVDIPYAALKKELQKASAAIHTMWNEHFGIAVVECIAAGLITVAHNSGGPRMDIVREGCGFRASTPEEYADAFSRIIRYVPLMLLTSSIIFSVICVHSRNPDLITRSSFFRMTESDRKAMSEAGKRSMSRFNERNFEDKFLEVIQTCVEDTQ